MFLAATLLQAQGVATRNAAPEARAKFSGKRWPVTFTDVTTEAGLGSMRFASGGEKTKKYIIEANGTGVALVEVYDLDP